jgi:hypothetical protein
MIPENSRVSFRRTHAAWVLALAAGCGGSNGGPEGRVANPSCRPPARAPESGSDALPALLSQTAPVGRGEDRIRPPLPLGRGRRVCAAGEGAAILLDHRQHPTNARQ